MPNVGSQNYIGNIIMKNTHHNMYNTLIGFDNIFNELKENALDKYPPYNVYKEGSERDRTILELALAGFNKEEISVLLDNGTLTVEFIGEKEEKRQREYSHRGISKRYFKRQFQLAEHQEIAHAEMKDGMLIITVDRILPDELKPKSINIR
jgi:molecular chaperone IbpA